MLLDTVLQSVHMKVTDNSSNSKKSFKFFDGGFCFLHTLELVVREFMRNESVHPWMIKIQGLYRHLKMRLSDWTCFTDLCAMRHVKILKPPIGGVTPPMVQMVESIYRYFDLDLSESHRVKLYIFTLLDPRFKKFKFWPTHKYVNNL